MIHGVYSYSGFIPPMLQPQPPQDLVLTVMIQNASRTVRPLIPSPVQSSLEYLHTTLYFTERPVLVNQTFGRYFKHLDPGMIWSACKGKSLNMFSYRLILSSACLCCRHCMKGSVEPTFPGTCCHTVEQGWLAGEGRVWLCT